MYFSKIHLKAARRTIFGGRTKWGFKLKPVPVLVGNDWCLSRSSVERGMEEEVVRVLGQGQGWREGGSDGRGAGRRGWRGGKELSEITSERIH